MLTDIVSYEDFDGNPHTETLYFNLSKTDVAANLDLVDDFQAMMDIFSEDQRDLTTPEKQKVLDLIVRVMSLSYGIRKDSNHFEKSPELWVEFKQSAAYDSYLWSLFENIEKANLFILGVLPSKIVEEAKRQVESGELVLPGTVVDSPPVSNDTNDIPDSSELETPVDETGPVEDDTRPAWIKEDREPTKAELTSMSREQLIEVTQRKLQK